MCIKAPDVVGTGLVDIAQQGHAHSETETQKVGAKTEEGKEVPTNNSTPEVPQERLPDNFRLHPMEWGPWLIDPSRVPLEFP